MQVSVFKGRSYHDWCDALAYSLYLIYQGRIGSNAEREYIAAERAARQYKRLASSIKDFRFDEVDEYDDEEISSEIKLNKSKSEQFSGYKINEEDEDFETEANEAKEGLLNSSYQSQRLRRSSSASSSSSVTPRGDGRNYFKYKTCSICLADFTKGEKVKVLPNCGHTFHGDCLEQWLIRQFRCPNCNMEIKAEEEKGHSPQNN